MATKHWFRNVDSLAEQKLIEDLIYESIQIYGVDIWYVRRKSLNVDNIIVDEKYGSFDAAYPCEVYVKSNEGFEGEGDFLSKFGLEIRDRMILTFARKAFKENVTDKSPKLNRPLEGDLIFFPLNKKLFEIKFVEHEPVFYQMGSLQAYDVTCELFEYGNELFNTGVTVIDNLWRYRMNQELGQLDQALDTGDETELVDENGDPIDFGGGSLDTGDNSYLVDDFGSMIGQSDKDPESNSPLAINSALEWEGRKTLDWSETDPFSEGGKY